MNSTCSIFFHNYYGRHEDWIKLFSQKITLPSTLFYNIVEDSIYTLEDDHLLLKKLQQAVSGPYLQKIILRRSPNLGKDIGGKLVLVDACLREGIESDYQLFIHDKKSPHKARGQEWRNKLLQIIEPDFIKKAVSLFIENPSIGIIAAADSIQNEFDFRTGSFTSNNRDHLQKLRAAFSIDNSDYRYVAGTMFWARSVPVLDFFRKYPPLEIRQTLEKGNIMDETHGSVTHAWERMLSWLTFVQGYTLKGI